MSFVIIIIIVVGCCCFCSLIRCDHSVPGNLWGVLLKVVRSTMAWLLLFNFIAVRCHFIVHLIIITRRFGCRGRLGNAHNSTIHEKWPRPVWNSELFANIDARGLTAVAEKGNSPITLIVDFNLLFDRCRRFPIWFAFRLQLTHINMYLIKLKSRFTIITRWCRRILQLVSLGTIDFDEFMWNINWKITVMPSATPPQQMHPLERAGRLSTQTIETKRHVARARHHRSWQMII